MEKIFENLQKAKSILKKNGIPETNSDFVKLKQLLSKNIGYLGKFTEWLVINKIPYSRLENLYDFLSKNKLDKPIDEFENPEKIIDKIIRDNAKSSINQIIKAIPSNTRDYLMYGEDYDEDDKRPPTTKEWKSIVSMLKRNLDKKDEIISFLSKKGGTFDNSDYEEDIVKFIDAIKKIINPINIESILKKIKSDENAKLIFNNNNLLIIAVNYEGVKKYGSSFWCITMDEDTFNEYTGIDNNDINHYHQQWIVYFKNKIPFVDDQSVMGITINKKN